MARFLGPSFDATLTPIDGVMLVHGSAHTNMRWDDLNPHAANRTYGEYLLSKVGKVLPQLRERD